MRNACVVGLLVLLAVVAQSLAPAQSQGAETSPIPLGREAPMAANTAVAEVVLSKVQVFDYRDVRLEPGLFQERFDLNRDYLLCLNNDSLLYMFRLKAGLPTPGVPYGGWCTVEGTQWPHNGQFQCDYLLALARSYVACGDERLKAKADAFVAGLAECQQPNGAIYAGDVSEDDIMYYTVDKWLKGLDQAHRCLGNEQAQQVRSGLVDWIESKVSELSDEQLQQLLDKEHGAICEALYDFYAETGEAQHLALAKRFEHRKILDPLARGEDNLEGLHVNTTIPKILGAARAYELTGDDHYRRIVENFWNIVADTRTYATGSSSVGEYWGKANALHATLDATTQETCVTYNWMKLTRYLWRWTGDPKYADMYERCLYNGIIEAQDPVSGMVVYFTPLKAGVREPDYTQEGAQAGSRKRFGTMFANFWCCTGTGAMALAGLADNEDSLYVNLFTPSQVRWDCGGTEVRLTQSTDYPDADSVRMELHLSAPTAFALMIRIPWWAYQGGELQVNDQPVDRQLEPGHFARLHRTWRDGDVVDLRLPMSLYSQPINDDPNCIAVMYGPHVMAGLTYGEYPLDITHEDIKIKGDPADPSQWLAPVPHQTMMFLTTAPDQNMVFMPLYRVVAERYGVYFDIEP